MTRTRSPVGGASAARFLSAVLALGCCGAVTAQTQSWVPGAGHGYASVAVQELYVDTHVGSTGNKGFPGTITNRTVFFNFDYGISDRLAVSVSLPFKSGMFEGPGAHDPELLDHDHGFESIDDGDFHAGWQDWRVGLRYLWRDTPLRITPFVAFGYPSHEYNTFAHSTIGVGQKQLQLGVNIGRQFAPPFQNVFFQAGYFYAVMEKVEEARRVNHSVVTAELGYFFTPRLSASLLVTGQKTHNGFNFPEDYPNFHDEHYFHHDQNLRNDFVNVGASVGYQLNDRYSAFLSYGHSVWGENTHLIDYAVTLGIARGF